MLSRACDVGLCLVTMSTVILSPLGHAQTDNVKVVRQTDRIRVPSSHKRY